MVFCVNKNSVHVAVPARHVSVKSFTFQVWANPETWSDRPGYQRESGWPVLISKSQSWFDGFGAYGSPDQTLHVYVGEWNKNLASTRLELGKWQCVTATFNFSLEGGVLSLYVDGVLKVLPLCLARAVLSDMRVCCVLSACGAMRGAMRGADGACRTRKARKEGLPPTRGNDAPLVVGSTCWGDAGWYTWHGAIGPVSLWQRALTDSEVLTAFRQGAMTLSPDFHLPLDEKEGNVAVDISAHAAHGAYMSSVTQVNRETLPEYEGTGPLPWEGGGGGGYSVNDVVTVVGITVVVAAMAGFAWMKVRRQA